MPDRIAGSVTVSVVDGLETVDVEHHQRQRDAVAQHLRRDVEHVLRSDQTALHRRHLEGGEPPRAHRHPPGLRVVPLGGVRLPDVVGQGGIVFVDEIDAVSFAATVNADVVVGVVPHAAAERAARRLWLPSLGAPSAACSSWRPFFSVA